MEFIATAQYSHRRNSQYEFKSSITLNKSKSIILCPPESIDSIPLTNNFTYRTEVYLQQREQQNVNKPLSSTTTTWKNVKYQKQALDDEQNEIDRALSTLNSIHDTFNRSLLIPFNQVYSSLYKNDNKSDHLMKAFCQCQNHCKSYELSMKDDDDDDDYDHNIDIDDDDNTALLLSDRLDHIQDRILDDTIEDEEEKENEHEKKKSYDSGYGSVIPKRQIITREPLLKITQPWSIM